jgi:hypothetical protein
MLAFVRFQFNDVESFSMVLMVVSQTSFLNDVKYFVVLFVD